VPKKCGKLKTKKTARKRKREADEKDEYVDSDNEDQSQEWEVEQIVGFRKGKVFLKSYCHIIDLMMILKGWERGRVACTLDRI